MKSQATPLVPPIKCALSRGERHDLATGFRAGDVLHLTADAEGHCKGAALPVLGFCLEEEADGTTYALRAYVAGATPYDQRQAARFPVPLQQERWFGETRPAAIAEIDVTDYPGLRLERAAEAKIIPMYSAAAAQAVRRKAA